MPEAELSCESTLEDEDLLLEEEDQTFMASIGGCNFLSEKTIINSDIVPISTSARASFFPFVM